ncbi:hypothetical protein JZ751_000693 [Albula glossodonta]|uniref:Uncharacterized protein n=1 Tax=Albula glossodonta TaxID=121402 RepID=A0A8T2PX32_9TELE|nr:hypothetical protein JZ751_000693 [Albula glossodonta]
MYGIDDASGGDLCFQKADAMILDDQQFFLPLCTDNTRRHCLFYGELLVLHRIDHKASGSLRLQQNKSSSRSQITFGSCLRDAHNLLAGFHKHACDAVCALDVLGVQELPKRHQLSLKFSPDFSCGGGVENGLCFFINKEVLLPFLGNDKQAEASLGVSRAPLHKLQNLVHFFIKISSLVCYFHGHPVAMYGIDDASGGDLRFQEANAMILDDQQFALPLCTDNTRRHRLFYGELLVLHRIDHKASGSLRLQQNKSSSRSQIAFVSCFRDAHDLLA